MSIKTDEKLTEEIIEELSKQYVFPYFISIEVKLWREAIEKALTLNNQQWQSKVEKFFRQLKSEHLNGYGDAIQIDLEDLEKLKQQILTPDQEPRGNAK